MSVTTRPTINDALIHDSIVRAVQNVCHTMLRHEATLAEKTADPARADFRTRAHVFGNVSFVGEANGVVYLCIPDDFATYAACRILGVSAGEASMNDYEVVRDVVGEVTNMTVGGFKNALCDVGFPCKLTLPTIVRGDNMSVATIKGTARHIFHFDCNGHRLVADIQIKAD